VTTVLDRLERAGYARRVPDRGDRRRVLVELTPSARKLLRDLFAPLAEGTMRQLEGYTTEQVNLVRDFMRDQRRLNEAHTERVRLRRRFDQDGEAASS
jgi:DNA-binding MarR family transcriptional regulator